MREKPGGIASKSSAAVVLLGDIQVSLRAKRYQYTYRILAHSIISQL
jgi:hypothetical protein